MSEAHEISLRERTRLNLVLAMKKAGVNQVQLAEKLGISKGTVNNWVRGNNSPDLDMVPKICDVLNISIVEFYSSNQIELMCEKNPPNAEGSAPEGKRKDIESIFNYLNQGLVSLGLIGENEDITQQQAEILIAVSRILSAAFQG